MKKLAIIPIVALLSGCMQTTPKLQSFNNDLKILQKYNIEANRLHKDNNGNSLFFITNQNGTFIYKLDKNMNVLMSKKVPIMINPTKLELVNNKIYLLGYSVKNQKPILLTFDKNGNLLTKKLYGNKFNTPRDFIIDKTPIVAINSYGKTTSTDIDIYKNNKKYSFASPLSEEVNFIRKFNNGYLILGNISEDTQNALIIYTDKNFKTKWALDIDYGVEEDVKSVKIKDNKIIVTINSQNYTGMESDFTITINKDGKIISKKQDYKIKDLPLKFHG